MPEEGRGVMVMVEVGRGRMVVEVYDMGSSVGVIHGHTRRTQHATLNTTMTRAMVPT